MSFGRALTIARINLVRLFRNRLDLFFILVLPLIIVLMTGLQFGGGFQARVAIVAVDGGDRADDLVAILERDWQVVRLANTEELALGVSEGRYAFGLTLPDRYTERLFAGEQVAIEYRAAQGDEALARRGIVEAAIAEQGAVIRAAAFAAAEASGTTAETLPVAEDLADRLPEVEVATVTVGERLFPEALAGFALGAHGQLILFIFLTSLTGASQLILSRTLGVSRRMLSTSTPMPSILLGEMLGRFAVALFQGLFIVIATALVFDVSWGDPLGAAALVIAFSLVSAGVAMLVGAVAKNAEQAASVGVAVALGIAAIGGSMVPPEIFPPLMNTISWFTPHRWAIDGFRELIAGGSIADIWLQIGVLLGIAAVLLGLATWRLRVALTR